MEKSAQQYWDTVYETKNANEVSWTQDMPTTSLDFIHSFAVPKSAKIFDIGGGDRIIFLSYTPNSFSR